MTSTAITLLSDTGAKFSKNRASRAFRRRNTYGAHTSPRVAFTSNAAHTGFRPSFEILEAQKHRRPPQSPGAAFLERNQRQEIRYGSTSGFVQSKRPIGAEPWRHRSSVPKTNPSQAASHLRGRYARY